MSEATGEAAAPRLPPHIVLVPPPEGDLTAPLWGVLTIFLIVAAGCAGMLSNPWAAVAAIFGAVATETTRRLIHRGRRRKRRKFLDQNPNIAGDGVAMALSREWDAWRFDPSIRTISRVLKQQGAPSGRALIIHFGWPNPNPWPRIQDLRFEPRIFTATDLRARASRAAMISGAAVLVLLGLRAMGWWLPFVPASAIGGLIGGSLGGAAIWVWRSAVRPTYFRLAPGIVQVLRYTTFGRRPTVRSYPMTAGTLVVVEPRKEKLGLVMYRDGRHDKLVLAGTRNPAEAMLQTWEALLSAAPIPQMSDTELLE